MARTILSHFASCHRGSIGSVLGNTIAALIVLLTVAVPVGGVGWGLWALIRRLRRRKAKAEEA